MHSRRFTVALAVAIFAGVFLASSLASSQQKSDTKTPQAGAPEMSLELFRKGVAEKLSKNKGRKSARAMNPNAGEKGIKMSIMTVLQQQKIAAANAHLEAHAALKTESAGVPAAAGTTMLLQPRSTPAAVPPTSTQSAPIAGKPMLVTGQAVAASKPQPTVQPGQALRASGNSKMQTVPVTPVAAKPQPNPISIAPRPLTMCFGPGIRAVNGRQNDAIFTPITEFNAYTITGCFFGTQPGHAYLIGKFNAAQIDLEIQYWSDNEIDARLDPKLSGELDQDNVSLVIVPASAPQMKTGSFKFMAVRSDPAVMLPSIPSSWAHLASVDAKINNFLYPSVNPQYYSPATDSPVPQEARGDSVYVSRYFNHKFPTGHDDYDFSQLAHGWTTDSMQLSSYDEDICPWVVTYKETFGSSFPEWQGDNIRVIWSDTSCSGFFPNPGLGGIPTSVYNDHTGSYYALNVWVRGPRCTDPYSGKPQQQCMQNVHLCGNETCGH